MLKAGDIHVKVLCLVEADLLTTEQITLSNIKENIHKQKEYAPLVAKHCCVLHINLHVYKSVHKNLVKHVMSCFTGMDFRFMFRVIISKVTLNT